MTRSTGAEVAEFLLDTEAASRLMRAQRQAVAGLSRSSAQSISVSSITMAELLYGALARGQPIRHGNRPRLPDAGFGSSVG